MSSRARWQRRSPPDRHASHPGLQPVMTTTHRPAGEKNVALNRKASHDYDIVRRLEAGISLTGSEIKSIRAGRISLQEAYVRPIGGDLWLLGAHIAPYEAASYLGHEPRRDRRL